jgi:hypothetical protein
LVDQVKDSSLILDEMEAEMATMSQTISARDATILKVRAHRVPHHPLPRRCIRLAYDTHTSQGEAAALGG